MRLHLELAGGLTGDMFLAAVLDAFPQFQDRVTATIDAVEEACAAYQPYNFRSVCDRLNGASIDRAIRAHSRNLLDLLAEAESAAHGVEAASSEFQVGAWDAIADIVGAAALIDALDAARWSASPVRVPQGMTPTGTAILRYLCPTGGSAAPKQYALVGSGTGFPSRSPCPCNPVRVLCFDEGADSLKLRARVRLTRIQPGTSRHN